ncbi:hypothetical protein JX266_006249 [Neoarthrinium moseri]|uniref:uncharacterized protein n=1 Tax=Neoarthrinium moseri TaxID=1658444 RepID=UPI001FDE97A3|nr:uncharacterized protein JN550_011792 [Neoarthrinium moseri]KAI1847754.1 hypothetical protein JX266_006249 [Neoarthrinium moseri]KAI1859981.1 hypothetical protein JN550_011792 [Neoarthrinium moseri]
MTIDEKYIGLALAMSSSLAIGTSFVITKKGLIMAGERHGFEGDGFVYLKNPVWWAGILSLVLGEICNFAAYAFAPAILVTPLGALSVLIGAVLGSYFLKEELGTLGKLGCAICLIGAIIIVLHAPPDEEIETIDQILHFAIQPGYLLYCIVVVVFASVMIYKIAPVHGKRNPLIYLSICSTVGSVSVMSVKAFGIAVKLTLGDELLQQGTGHISHANASLLPTTEARLGLIVGSVNPLYYVTFTTATLCASFILFSGFNTTDPVNTLSLLCGFLVTFTGVYLLNLSRADPNGDKMLGRRGGQDTGGTDMISSIQTRLSMSARRSTDPRGSMGDREGLMRAYDEEAAGFGLADLAEESDDDAHRRNGNGHVRKSRGNSIELQPKSGER